MNARDRMLPDGVAHHRHANTDVGKRCRGAHWRPARALCSDAVHDSGAVWTKRHCVICSSPSTHETAGRALDWGSRRFTESSSRRRLDIRLQPTRSRSHVSITFHASTSKLCSLPPQTRMCKCTDRRQPSKTTTQTAHFRQALNSYKNHAWNCGDSCCIHQAVHQKTPAVNRRGGTSPFAVHVREHLRSRGVARRKQCIAERA